ncbi:hypothetical protein B0H11DRAFT_2239097 [Mycena galericulata]|nr:hypothetical protein B0H11DRAFT_2239097 [Mycena galericulata]
MSQRDPPHLPQINDESFYCLKATCGHRLRLKRCAKGTNADRHYLHCDNPEHPKPYWFFFPRGVAPSRSPQLPTVPNQSTLTTASATPKCAETGCSSSRARRCLLHSPPTPTRTTSRRRQLAKINIIGDDAIPFSLSTLSVSLAEDQIQFNASLEALRHESPNPTPPKPSLSTALAQTAQNTFLLITWLVNGSPALVEGVQTV